MADLQSFAVPTYPGLVGDHTTARTLIGRTGDQAGTLTRVNTSWLNGVNPTIQITCRVGTDLAGVAGVDYVEFFPSTNNQSVAISLPVAANVNVFFTIEDPGNNTGEDLFGSVQFTSSSTQVVAGGVLYATVADVKAAIGVPAGNTDRDASIEADILAVSRHFDSMATQPFAQQTRTEFHDGWAHRNGIALKRFVSELLSDREAGITVEENGTALIFGTDWRIDDYPANVIYRMRNGQDSGSARFAIGERNIKVIYPTAFFEIPASISRACRDEAQRAQLSQNHDTDSGSSRIGISSRTPAEGTTIAWTEDTLTQTTLMALAPYRNGLWGN